MKPSLVVDRNRFTGCLCLLFCLLPIWILTACGDSGSGSVSAVSGSPETGSAKLSVDWHQPASAEAASDPRSASALDCAMVGVQTIKAKVYAQDDTQVAWGGPWDCADGQGRIDGIPLGDVTIVILGVDSGDNIIYQGQKSGVTIEARPDNDAGTIDAHPFVPATLSATAASVSRIDLTWSAGSPDVQPAGYLVYRGADIIGTTDPTTTAFGDTGLTAATQYCYTVVAYDRLYNESAPTIQTCATTNTAVDTQPPSIPTGLTTSAYSISRIDLSWTASTDNVGVGGYAIARNGVQIGTSEAISYSDTNLNPSTEYCYSVAAFDTSGNFSAFSSERCTTTSGLSTWYHDGDGDGYGNPDDSRQSTSQPQGYVSNNADCDDANASVNPGATEICDEIDNNCSGSIDEGVLITYFRDGDGDGYGDPDVTIQACTAPQGYISDDSDCNDMYTTAFPGATEICNDGLDNDCNGLIDDVYTNVPQPELELIDKQTVVFGSGSYTIYSLSVVNLTSYPAEFFVISSSYPSCPAQESDGSRTVLEIYDSDDTLRSSEYCALTSPMDLDTFYLYVFSGGTYPEALYITLYDQECGITWTSNLAVVVPPTQVSPNGYQGANPGTTTFVWEAVPGAVSYTIEVQVQGSTVAMATDIQGVSHTLTYPDFYGEWRVWAVDSLGNSGPASGLMSFYYD
jgi:chitodextrinase